MRQGEERESSQRKRPPELDFFNEEGKKMKRIEKDKEDKRVEELLKNQGIQDEMQSLLTALAARAGKAGSSLRAEDIQELLKETVNDEKTKNILLETLQKEVREIYNLEEDVKMEISDLKKADKGISSFHKIVSFEKDGRKVVLHAKNTATSSQLRGSKLCEIFGYKILEELGYGPKIHSAVIGPDLMLTITEDIISTKREKHSEDAGGRTFKTLKQLQEIEKKDSVEVSSENDREESLRHFFMVDILRNILKMSDLLFNSGNLGIRETPNKSFAASSATELRKFRPMIIDFNFNPGAEEAFSFEDPEILAKKIILSPENNRALALGQQIDGKRKLKASYKLDDTIAKKIVNQVVERLKDGKKSEDESNSKPSLIEAVEKAFKYVQEFQKKVSKKNQIPIDDSNNQSGVGSVISDKNICSGHYDIYSLDPVHNYKEEIKERFTKFFEKFEQEQKSGAARVREAGGRN